MGNSLFWLISIFLILVGLLGTVLPVLPGAPLAFVGILIAAWIDNFQKVGAGTLILIGVLSVLTLAIDIIATSRGAARAGASKRAIIGATLGTIIGIFFAPFGLIIGPFAGAMAGELTVSRDVQKAGRIGFATWLGLIVGVALKVAVVFMMIAIFITAYLWN